MDRDAQNRRFTNEGTHWWFVSRRKILKKILSKFLDNHAGRAILEVGCGSGGNLKLLSAFGNLSAMAIDDEARRRANARNICSVNKVSLPDDIPYEIKFELICMLDVLEHIDDDWSAVKALKEILEDNGKFLITVPAYNFLWSSHD